MIPRWAPVILGGAAMWLVVALVIDMWRRRNEWTESDDERW